MSNQDGAAIGKLMEVVAEMILEPWMAKEELPVEERIAVRQMCRTADHWLRVYHNQTEVLRPDMLDPLNAQREQRIVLQLSMLVAQAMEECGYSILWMRASLEDRRLRDLVAAETIDEMAREQEPGELFHLVIFSRSYPEDPARAEQGYSYGDDYLETMLLAALSTLGGDSHA